MLRATGSFSGRSAIVTGGASGIGLALGAELALVKDIATAFRTTPGALLSGAARTHAGSNEACFSG